MPSGFVKDRVRIVVRQRGTIALVLLMFAMVQAARVAVALWHGVSLHGAYLEPHPGKPYTVLMPVWDTFIQAVSSAVVGGVLLLSKVQEQVWSSTRRSRRHPASPRR